MIGVTCESISGPSDLKEIIIKISIPCDVQHDGFPWKQGDIEASEQTLVEYLTSKTKFIIEKSIKEIKPFSVHGS